MENNIYIRKENYKSLKWHGYKIKHLEKQGEEFLEIGHWKRDITLKNRTYLIEFREEVRMLQFLLLAVTLVAVVLYFIYSILWLTLIWMLTGALQLWLPSKTFHIKEVEYIERDFLEINPLIEEYKVKVK